MDEDIASIDRLQSGDEAGLAELMLKYKDGVFRLAFRYTGNSADAADIAEETFVKLFFNANKYAPKAKVKTWIFTIASNLCKDHIRRSKKAANTFSLHQTGGDENSSSSPEERLSDARPVPSEIADSKERVHEIEKAIQSLPEKLRFPFIFCVLEEHSYLECSEILKISTKAVEAKIYRARRKLQKALS